MRALCHVSLAILNKLNHFNAHVCQLRINHEGRKKGTFSVSRARTWAGPSLQRARQRSPTGPTETQT